MYIVVYIVMIAIYCVSPLPLQGVMFVINMLVPDPIPVLDEVVMAISSYKKLKKIVSIYAIFQTIASFIRTHVVAIVCFILLLAAIAYTIF